MQILVVEDSPEVSLITVEYLQELGHGAVAVADAERGLEELEHRSFDAVITDVSLPGMSGIKFAKELAAMYPHLPVVIASGYGALDLELVMGNRQSTVLVLPKPYDMGMLDKALQTVASAARG